MAYEYQYESGIKNIIHRYNLWVSDTDYKNAKESLNEVYRKAKAFDEILNITQLQHEEEYADNVISVIDKFTEDKQND